MKKLLVLGTGKDQVFGIEKAKDMGLYIIGLDVNPDSDGAELVDEFYKVNVKDVYAVGEFVRGYKGEFDGVIAFGVDIPEVLARVAEIRGLVFYTDFKSASLSKDKFLAKERLKRYSVSLPEYRKISSFEGFERSVKELGLPVVLKPVDNSGARGVLRVTEGVDLRWAFEYAKAFCTKDYLILEKFLDGVQISSESFVLDGKIYTVGLSKRNYEFLDRFSPFIIENGGDLPPKIGSEYLRQIDVQIEKCARAFGVRNGVIKGDIVISENKVFIIEVALRLSGGHLSSIEIPLNTGVDFLKHAITLSLGEDVYPEDLMYKTINFVSLRYIFPHKKGIIKRLAFPSWVRDDLCVYAYDFYFKEGDVAHYPVKSHPERLGYFVVAAPDEIELVQKMDRIYRETVVEID